MSVITDYVFYPPTRLRVSIRRSIYTKLLLEFEETLWCFMVVVPDLFIYVSMHHFHEVGWLTPYRITDLGVTHLPPTLRVPRRNTQNLLGAGHTKPKPTMSKN